MLYKCYIMNISHKTQEIRNTTKMRHTEEYVHLQKTKGKNA